MSEPSHDVAPPRPEQVQPRLWWWSHLWRLGLMLLISGYVFASVEGNQGETIFLVDVVLGLVAFVLVWWRRRWPVAVAVITVALSGFSSLASGPGTLATVSVATRRRWREVVPVALLNLVSALVLERVQPATTEDPGRVVTWTFIVIFTAAIMAWGLYIGSRRELLWTLRARAERAETEQELMVAQSRLGERSRIAREMHDVLAHRISQISMHAGALTYRDDLTAEQMRETAGVVQQTAQQALTDLRGVLGVLRDGTHAPELAPLPTYADLGVLVADAAEAGVDVDLDDAVDQPVPDRTGRAVFRIVQEGITNAAKHAPGARLSIELAGSPDDGLLVTLRNPIGFRLSRAIPGASLGLVGLTERAELLGGRLEHGREGDEFALRAWLPWAA